MAAFTPGEPIAGRFLSGSADGQFAELATEAAGGGVTRLAEIEVGDRDAVAAGLSCGGRARVLLQRADDVPAVAWAMLVAREPVCLAPTSLTINWVVRRGSVCIRSPGTVTPRVTPRR